MKMPKVNKMGMGEGRAPYLFMDVLLAPKPFKRFLCNHQMGIGSWHRRPTLLGLKSIEITI